jgi:hypothetical protein
MPALKNPSLAVLDNASYHNVKTEALRVPACNTIKRLPLPEGIFGASDPSFGSHIQSVQ